jgi:hypothetical protein
METTVIPLKILSKPHHLTHSSQRFGTTSVSSMKSANNLRKLLLLTPKLRTYAQVMKMLLRE